MSLLVAIPPFFLFLSARCGDSDTWPVYLDFRPVVIRLSLRRLQSLVNALAALLRCSGPHAHSYPSHRPLLIASKRQSFVPLHAVRSVRRGPQIN
ncbi:uncharacterized protein BO66DRAFT_7249 [Aspergillus aculeatinus CBS 121060]|uniref:Uncharacterized protein n=1 Tax=Aspergillus aculeatinus CBS 121060 TaxID=1448322 RepID=A0ACD1HND1_9EURO|nr:hypothetical protein BO66DRAFT_7249 [Aspergillus aculeatinus CBS 121060]RAH75369.1 hypothetical protein BO66DRAFT_7249 [Aspergillus aculeatinus CBS 121060]